MSSRYEKRILQVLGQHRDGLTTINVAEEADISKTTALKYLASLKAEGKIGFIEVGPAKLWRLASSKGPRGSHCPVTRKDRIESMLRKFKEAVGLQGSAVVDSQGLPISSDLPWDVNPEKFSSIISHLLQIGSKSTDMAKIEPLKDIIVEGERGRIVARNERNLLLIAFSGPDTPLGMLKVEIEEFARRIHQLLD